MGPWTLAEAAVKACLSAPARALPGDDNASASVLERALNEMRSMRRRKPLTDEEAALLDAIYYAGYVHLLRERWLWSRMSAADIDRQVRQLAATVSRVIAQVRRSAISVRVPANSVHSTSPRLLRVTPLVDAPCAPPAWLSSQLIQGQAA